MKQVFCASVCLFLACVAAYGDILVFKNSHKQIEGTVTESGDLYFVTTLTGQTMNFKKDTVETIIRKPLPAKPAPVVPGRGMYRVPTGPDGKPAKPSAARRPASLLGDSQTGWDPEKNVIKFAELEPGQEGLKGSRFVVNPDGTCERKGNSGSRPVSNKTIHLAPGQRQRLCQVLMDNDFQSLPKPPPGSFRKNAKCYMLSVGGGRPLVYYPSSPDSPAEVEPNSRQPDILKRSDSIVKVFVEILGEPPAAAPPGGSSMPPASSESRVSTAMQTVILKDGRRITGEVNGNNRPNDYLIFKADGSVEIVPKADVVSIIRPEPSQASVSVTATPPPPPPSAVATVPTRIPPTVAPPPPQSAPGTTLAAVATPPTPSEVASTIHFRVQKTIKLEKNLQALGSVNLISPDFNKCILIEKRRGFAHRPEVHVFDLNERRVIPLAMLQEKGHFAFSPDSKLIAGAGFMPSDLKDNIITIRLWDAQTGRELAILDRMPASSLMGSAGASMRGIAFDRTSGFVAVTGQWSPGSINQTTSLIIKIYSVGGGQYQKLHDLSLGNMVTGDGPIAFSPDNKAIYVRVYPQGRKLEMHRVSLLTPNSPSEVMFELDDNPAVFAAGVPLAVRGRKLKEVFDLQRKLSLGTFGTYHEVEAMAFSPDNRSLCVGTSGHGNLPHHLAVWDVIERKRISVLPDANEFYHPESLQFSADGRRIAAAGDHDLCSIRIWEMSAAMVAEAPASQITLKETLRLPEGAPRAVSADLSRCLLSRNYQEQNVLCETSTGKEIVTLDGFWNFQFSQDSKYLAGCGGTKNELYSQRVKTIRLWDAHTGTELGTLDRIPVNAGFSPEELRHSPLLFDRTGSLFAAASGDYLKVFSVASNSFRKILERPLAEPDGQPLQAMFAPDGRSLYLRLDPGSRSSTHIIRRAALVDGVAPTEYAGSIENSYTMTFCHAAPWNVRMGGKTIEVWNQETKSPVGRIDAVCYNPLLDVSPDDRMICAYAINTGDVAAGLTFWSLSGLRRLATVNVPKPELVAFSADGRQLAAIRNGQMSILEISPATLPSPATVASAANVPPPVLTADESHAQLRLVNVRELMPAKQRMPVWSCRLMPDGKTLLYLVKHRNRYQWTLRDITTGSEKPLPIPAPSHFADSCSILAANCVTPDGRTIVVCTGVDANKDGVIAGDERNCIALYDVASSTARMLDIQGDSIFATLDATGKMLFVRTGERSDRISPRQNIYSTMLDNIALRPMAVVGHIFQPCPTATLLPIINPGPNRLPILYDYCTGKMFNFGGWTGDQPGLWTRDGRYFYALSETNGKCYCWDRMRGKSVGQIENIGKPIGPGPTPSSMVMSLSNGIALHDAEKDTLIRVGTVGLRPISSSGKTLIYVTSDYNPTICMAEIEIPAGPAKL